MEYCYFTQCNGDGEIISSKARQNVYRFNTFENNPVAELVLRHGSENIVYGNFFLNGAGGIRVREGQNHYIYNNYFYDLTYRAIFLQNDAADPLENINIAFNTIIECGEIRFGGSGNNQPTNVTLFNNIFTDPVDFLFEDLTGSETWVGNIAKGNIGIILPSSGLTIMNPVIEENNGFFGLSEISPAIDAALSGFADLPQYSGMEPIDTDISFDIMGQARPEPIAEKDLGCNEFPHDTLIQPHATEENTGPSYNTSVINSVKENNSLKKSLIQIAPNPTADYLIVLFDNKKPAIIKMDIFNQQSVQFF